MLDLSQNAVTDQLQIGQASHPGRSGKNNEDYYGVFSVATAGGECVVAAVADGIGGSVGGEQASRLAINAMHASLNDPLYVATSLGQRLDQAIRLANRQIYERSQNEPALAGMGTTIVAVALDGERLYVAHAGDSRAYLIRGGRAHQLTLDHSWAQEAIEAGRIKPEEAKTHPNRHVIRRFLGINEEVETDPRVVDPAQAGSGRAATVASPILTQGGDAILLCSDGLTDEVSDEEIARLVGKHAPAEAARRLIDAANAAGGADNITAVILQRGAGKAAAAAGRSRLAAVGLALMAALIVGALGWLIASGALFGKPDGSVAASDATPSVAAAVLATSTPVAAADAAVRPTAAATTEATLEATAEAAAIATPGVESDAGAPEQTPTATYPATATPAAGVSEPATSEPVTSEPVTSAEPAASVQPTSMSTPVPARDAANLGGGAKNDPSAPAEIATEATGEATTEATIEATTAASATPAEAAALAVTVTSTAIPAVTPTAQPPSPTVSPTAPPTAPPTSTPVGPKTSTPTLTATPTTVVRSMPTQIPSRVTPMQLPTPVAVAPAPDGATAPLGAPVANEPGGPTAITNVRPAYGANFNENDTVEFAWTANADLLPGQVYEIAFWRASQVITDGRSEWAASPANFVPIVPKNYGLEGTYRWTVWLRSTDPNKRIRDLGTYEINISGSRRDDGSPGPEPEPTTKPPGQQ